MILPSRPGTIRAYEIFIDKTSIGWELNYNPNSVKLARCQVRNRFTYTPDFEYKIVDFSVNEFRKICEDLESLIMPPVFSKLHWGGFDGTEYEFEFNKTVLRIRYHWSLPTEEIRPLADYCYKMNRNFETLLERATREE